MQVSAQDRERIAAAIRAAEARTAGEIVVVLARESDDYRFVPLLWAALAGLAIPLPLIWFTRLPALHIQLIALAAFVALALVLSVPAIRLAVVPGALKRRTAHKAAVEQFLARNLHVTAGRTGVLIFTSLAEHYVEIIADQAIASKVGQEVWDNAVKALTAEAKAGRVADGILKAVGLVAEILAAHFPPQPADLNELPNHLVEI